MEAARWWGGYTLGTWMREDTVFRARVTAHYLHMTMREAYVTDKMMKNNDKTPAGKTPGSVLSRFGI